jgi:hypothetical protein
VAGNEDLNPQKIWKAISKTLEHYFTTKIRTLTLDTIMNSMNLACVNYKIDYHYVIRSTPY